MQPTDSRTVARGGPAAGGPAGELIQLLEIIGGTTEQLENIWEGDPGSEKYLSMLRLSVERAAGITAQLVAQAGAKAIVPASDSQSLPNLPSLSKPKARILVVDDEPSALALFRQMLEAPGYEVTTAESGFECLDKISREDFGLVVLDYTMPFMDGEETFRRIHSLRPDVPVLLSTGFIDPARLNDLLASGLAAFLRKPLAPPELIECVAGLLGGERGLPEAADPRGIAAAL